MKAAIGTDGMRFVVWGVGATDAAAIADAQAQDFGGMPQPELSTYEITNDDASRVNAGEVGPITVRGHFACLPIKRRVAGG